MMTNTGVYMNKLTIKRKQKGYSEDEMLSALGVSLRTYRRWEKPEHKMNEWLIDAVNNLESKNDK